MPPPPEDMDPQEQEGPQRPLDALAPFLEPAPRGTDPASLRAYARSRAQQLGMDPDFIDRIFTRESGYNPRAVSSAGAQGIGQLVTGTSKRYGVRNPFDPYQNMEGSLAYLQDLHKRFQGDKPKVAAGYFAGENKAEAALRNPKDNPKTAEYVAATAGQRPQPQQPRNRRLDVLEQYLEPQAAEDQTQVPAADQTQETGPAGPAPPAAAQGGQDPRLAALEQFLEPQEGGAAAPPAAAPQPVLHIQKQDWADFETAKKKAEVAFERDQDVPEDQRQGPALLKAAQAKGQELAKKYKGLETGLGPGDAPYIKVAPGYALQMYEGKKQIPPPESLQLGDINVTYPQKQPRFPWTPPAPPQQPSPQQPVPQDATIQFLQSLGTKPGPTPEQQQAMQQPSSVLTGRPVTPGLIAAQKGIVGSQNLADLPQQQAEAELLRNQQAAGAELLRALPQNERKWRAVELAKYYPLSDEERKLANFNIADNIFQNLIAPAASNIVWPISGIVHLANMAAAPTYAAAWFSGKRGEDLADHTEWSFTRLLDEIGQTTDVAQRAGGQGIVRSTVRSGIALGALAPLNAPAFVMHAGLSALGRGESLPKVLLDTGATALGMHLAGAMGEQLSEMFENPVMKFAGRAVGIDFGLKAGNAIVLGEVPSSVSDALSSLPFSMAFAALHKNPDPERIFDHGEMLAYRQRVNDTYDAILKDKFGGRAPSADQDQAAQYLAQRIALVGTLHEKLLKEHPQEYTYEQQQPVPGPVRGPEAPSPEGGAQDADAQLREAFNQNWAGFQQRFQTQAQQAVVDSKVGEVEHLPDTNRYVVRSEDGRVGVIQFGKDGTAHFGEVTNAKSLRQYAGEGRSKPILATEFEQVFPRDSEGYMPGAIEDARSQFIKDQGLMPKGQEPITTEPRKPGVPVQEGGPYATEAGIQPQGRVGEYPGVPPGENVPTYPTEVREGARRQAGGRGRPVRGEAVEKEVKPPEEGPPPAPPVPKPPTPPTTPPTAAPAAPVDQTLTENLPEHEPIRRAIQSTNEPLVAIGLDDSVNPLQRLPVGRVIGRTAALADGNAIDLDAIKRVETKNGQVIWDREQGPPPAPPTAEPPTPPTEPPVAPKETPAEKRARALEQFRREQAEEEAAAKKAEEEKKAAQPKKLEEEGLTYDERAARKAQEEIKTQGPTIAARMRSMADAMKGEIQKIEKAEENFQSKYTERLAAPHKFTKDQLETMDAEHNRRGQKKAGIKELQSGLRALADAYEKGEVPDILNRVRTKAVVKDLLDGTQDKMPRWREEEGVVGTRLAKVGISDENFPEARKALIDLMEQPKAPAAEKPAEKPIEPAPVKPAPAPAAKPAEPPEAIPLDEARFKKLDDTYSGDTIGDYKKSRIRGIFEHEGERFVSTGGVVGANGFLEAWRVVPASEYKGPTITYAERVAQPYKERVGAFYEGMKVKYRGKDFVLTGPEQVFRPAEAGKEPAKPEVPKETPAERKQRIAEQLKRMDELGKKGQKFDDLSEDIKKPSEATDGRVEWRERRNTLVLGDRAAQLVDQITETEGRRRGRVTRFVDKLLGPTWTGFAVEAPMARRIADAAEGLAATLKDTGTQGATKKILGDIADAFIETAKKHPEFTVAIYRGMETRQTIRHEEVHRTQFMLSRLFGGIPEDRLTALPSFDVIKKGLGRKAAGYKGLGDVSVALEGAAHIMAGQERDLYLTDNEAENFLRGYYQLIGEHYGSDAIKQFSSTIARYTGLRDRAFRIFQAAEEGTFRQGGRGVQGVPEARGRGAPQVPTEGAEAGAKRLNLFEQAGLRPGGLTSEEINRVEAKFDALREQAKQSGQPLRTAVEDYLKQGGLFGQELNEEQRNYLRTLAGSSKVEARRQLGEQGSLFDLASDYDKIPLRPGTKNALVDIASSFIEEGRTDHAELINEFEQLLGPKDFDRVADHLPTIFARAMAESVRPEAPKAPPKKAPEEAPGPVAALGKESQATTPRGIRVNTRYALVSADQPITSHDMGLKENPDFPAVLQNRDRSKVASEDDLQEKIKRYEPGYYAPTIDASTGPPILGRDMVTESGNGRVILHQRLYRDQPKKAQQYVDYIKENAAQFGFTPEQIDAVKNPLIVRIRTTDLSPTERIAFAHDANNPSMLERSAVEVARSDAQQLSPELMQKFVLNDKGVIHTAGNQEFVRGFLDEVVGPNRGGLTTSDGLLNQAGVSRIRHAIFAKAYGETTAGIEALEKLSESTDDNTKRVSTAMLQTAPRWVVLKDDIKQESRYPLDLSNDLAQAARHLSLARAKNQDVEEYLRQLGLFGDAMTPLQKKLFYVLDKYGKSEVALRSILTNYLDTVDELGDPRQSNMWAKQQEPPTKDELLEAAVRSYNLATGKISELEGGLTEGIGGEAAPKIFGPQGETTAPTEPGAPPETPRAAGPAVNEPAPPTPEPTEPPIPTGVSEPEPKKPRTGAGAGGGPRGPKRRPGAAGEPPPVQRGGAEEPGEAGGRGVDERGIDRPVDIRTDRLITAREHQTRRDFKEELVPEKLRGHLEKHQLQGAALAIEAMDKNDGKNYHGGFLLADGTGAGKTREILTVAQAMKEKGHPVLIVVPNEVLKPDWEKGTVVGSYDKDGRAMGVEFGLASGKGEIKQGIHLTTYHRFADLRITPDTVVIFDEAQALKNSDSSRSQAGQKLAREAHAVLYATATPADKATHLEYLARAGILENKSVEKAFQELGMIQRKVKKGKKDITVWEVNPRLPHEKGETPSDVVRERIDKLFGRITNRGLMIKRELSLKDVPIEFRRVPLPPEGHETMDAIDQGFGGLANANGLRKARILMHMRRQQEPYKVDTVADMTKEELDQGRQVVIYMSRINESEAGQDIYAFVNGERVNIGREVYAQSEGTSKLLGEALRARGINDIAELHGNAPTSADQAMRDFNSGKSRVIVATLESGGTGINLDDIKGDSPRTMIMVTAPFSGMDNVQAAGRVWRLSSKSIPKLRYVFSDHPIDDWNASIIAEKMRQLKATVQGEVGKLDVPKDFSVAPDGVHIEPVNQAGPAPSEQDFAIAPTGTVPPIEEPSVPVEKGPEGAPEAPIAPSEGNIRGAGEDGKARLDLLAAGVPQFVEQDVVPKMKAAAQGVVDEADAIRGVFAAGGRSKEAELAAGVIREYNAKRARGYDQADAALAHLRTAFDRIRPLDPAQRSPEVEQLIQNKTISEDDAFWVEFIHRMETGKAQITPELDAAAKQIRTVLDYWRTQVQNLGKGKLQNFYIDYFPHIWQDAKAAKKWVEGFYLGKRPLEGPKAFLKKRSHPLTVDGLDAHLKPVSDNPIDLVLLKVREMQRYWMGQKILDTQKQMGLVRFIPADMRGPAGWRKLPDPIGTVLGPPFVESAHREAYDKLLMESLNKVARDIGVPHSRLAKISGKERDVWGYTSPGGDIVTRLGGPESVLAHEIGHQLGYKYHLFDTFTNNPDKKIRSAIKNEWRALADMRWENQPVSEDFKQYVREDREKEAVLLEAYIHAPERFQQVAPTLYHEFETFLKNNPMLKPITDIRPSLVIGESTQVEQIPLEGINVTGHYWGPESVTRLFDNFLTPGLADRYKTVAALKTGTNILNQAQLAGFFHGGFVTMEAALSKGALAAEQLLAGKPLAAAGSLIQTIVPGLSALTTALEGRKLYKSWRDMAQPTPEIQALLDQVMTGGGRAGPDPGYATNMTRQMRRAFARGNLPGGLLRVPFAALEQISKPILEHYVPYMKLGVMADLVRAEHMQAGAANLSHAELTVRLGKAWDSVDNRLGQLVYDNLFWPRTVKDMGMILLRTLGWNLGTWREVGGAMMIDVPKAIGQVVRGQRPEFTHRMAYALMMPVVTAWYGALIGAAFGQKPKEIIDYFAPRTGRFDDKGNPERVWLPTYMRDLIHAYQEPGRTLVNKLNPVLTLTYEMLRNRDFYNVKIRNEDDPRMTQAKDMLKHLIGAFEPIGVRTGRQARAGGEGIAGTLLPQIGITPVPKRLTESKLERSLNDLSAQQDFGPRTKEEAERKTLLARLRRQVSGGQDMTTQALELARTGKIREEDVPDLLKSETQSPLARRFESLRLPDALKLYVRDATPAERAELAPVIQRKLAGIEKLPEAERDQSRQLAALAGLDVTAKPKLEQQRDLEVQVRISRERARQEMYQHPEWSSLTPQEQDRARENLDAYFRLFSLPPEASRLSDENRQTLLQQRMDRLNLSADQIQSRIKLALLRAKKAA